MFDALIELEISIGSMVPQAGLEPATYGLEDRYSIQLSYWGSLDSLQRFKL